ncbi:MAG: 16S rRNA (cytidine(1402)-2'-O)-methyltransferase [Lactobacillaceae bacterium]|nr:16S rRNA (cytidine(1402)-2'-O)-methyltransferase [Lactobacillaceae bacterium]
MEQRSFSDSEIGKLYLVPTPIGNLEDITVRALKILEEVDIIAAEDTRHSGILLQHFNIKKPMLSLHEHNYAQRIPQLINEIKQGKSIAQISDAGMPSISDPGHELVVAAIENDISVIALPGPTASITALIASGLTVQPFTFIGFLPKKNNEQKIFLNSLKNRNESFIFYESPYRLLNTLNNILESLGTSTKIVAAREITKKFESYVRGNVSEVIDFFNNHEPKGEFVLMVQAIHEAQKIDVSDQEIVDEIKQIVLAGEKPNIAIKEIAKKYNQDRNKIYNLYNEVSNG